MRTRPSSSASNPTGLLRHVLLQAWMEDGSDDEDLKAARRKRRKRDSDNDSDDDYRVGKPKRAKGKKTACADEPSEKRSSARQVCVAPNCCSLFPVGRLAAAAVACAISAGCTDAWCCILGKGLPGASAAAVARLIVRGCHVASGSRARPCTNKADCLGNGWGTWA